MDPDKQDALNSIENSIYRTAFKLQSVQLCTVDLIGSSQIQHLLLHQHFWEARESSLSVQQVFQALQLFQKVRVEKPGQMHPRSSELTLSLLMAMYDRSQLWWGRGMPCALWKVLRPAIKEESFLSWLQSEQPILLWLPISYQLSVTEMVTHPVRCNICRNFPITGLRYRCLKCLNFDICQMCFMTAQRKSHQKCHPVIEHCVQMSAKENAKILLRTLRNNLLQGCCKRKEAERRQHLLHQVKSEDFAHCAQARFLKKQLNQCDKLQTLYASQEEKSYRFETKIKETAKVEERKDELGEEELQLLSKCMDAFSLEMSSDNLSTVSRGSNGQE
ncbi:LOW QUALITY PROTEIN: dystrotelin [Rhynchocyon petersi]